MPRWPAALNPRATPVAPNTGGSRTQCGALRDGLGFRVWRTGSARRPALLPARNLSEGTPWAQLRHTARPRAPTRSQPAKPDQGPRGARPADKTLARRSAEFSRTSRADAGPSERLRLPPPRLHRIHGRRRREPGHRHRRTGDYGYYAIEDEVHVHDLQATTQHPLGLDHERPDDSARGRAFHLTDVEGVVVDDIMV